LEGDVLVSQALVGVAGNAAREMMSRLPAGPGGTTFQLRLPLAPGGRDRMDGASGPSDP
ncbi:MAG: hypothetical protein H6Q88_1053, partial [Anaeromyxobacteraceae bacterium]|nr:hypothetical protein [Anaeromyxobacteraceae bacterium]